MTSFPVDAPQERVIKALVCLGFVEYSKKEHIKMVRNNADGTSTKLALLMDNINDRAHCLTEESYFERRGCLMGNLTLSSFCQAVDSWDMGHCLKEYLTL